MFLRHLCPPPQLPNEDVQSFVEACGRTAVHGPSPMGACCCSETTPLEMACQALVVVNLQFSLVIGANNFCNLRDYD